MPDLPSTTRLRRILVPLAVCLAFSAGCRAAPDAAGAPPAQPAAVVDPPAPPDDARVASAADSVPGGDAAVAIAGPAGIASRATKLDAYTIVGERHFQTGWDATNSDGTINAVIEIPAGMTDKWEVDPSDGNLRWEIKDGKPRIVQYLGYPVNYGMVPRTVLAETLDGGDGDPLDILLLGDALPRGTVVPVKAIGVARFTDSGERDDKLLVVRAGTPFEALDDISELDAQFIGVTQIIQTWFLNYKGPGVFTAEGWGNAEEARALLQATMDAFEAEHAANAAASGG